MSTLSKPMRYTLPQSFVDSSFFSKLAQLKLEKYKLDSTTRDIFGYQSLPSKLNKFDDVPTVSLDEESFNQDASDSTKRILQGELINVNTIEEFKNINKQNLLSSWGRALQEVIWKSRDFDCKLFFKFAILSFSDLKKYKFYYWLAFPTLQSNWTKLEEKNVDKETLELIEPYLSNSEGQQQQQQQQQQQFYQFSEKKLFSTFDIAKDHTFVFFDSCLSHDKRPAAQLKNYLYYLAYKGLKTINLIVYRNNGLSFQNILELESAVSPDELKVVGWERTSQGKLGPKMADLSALSDPHELAAQAVDLNLRLMKWRVAPELDLEILKAQTVLLLGAGTLGSYVARALLGWGFREINFIDNGQVSYSNPVRQSLYNFKDCFSDNGRGATKATTAAENLKSIFPGVRTSGFDIGVPMIGHPITDEETQKANYQTLEQLFDKSDVVFLLMDSRESRWLPTVMGAAKGKLVINAALGFDSYLVMRHGNANQHKENKLGCYFCNDIVAPEDSLSDRTLDQMCTVTRPGGALMASSLAVELLVSLLQHPKGQNASHNDSSSSSSKFGTTPHQIRGFLSNFTQSLFFSPSYPNCSACSPSVVTEYRQNGWEFVKKCLNDPEYLENLCGLKKVQEDAELAIKQLLPQMDLDEDDEDNEWLS